MKYKCSKEIPICEFYNNGECINMEDCAHAVAVIVKPLAEWTLREVKTECASRSYCASPTRCAFLGDDGICRIDRRRPYTYRIEEVKTK